MLDGLCQRAAPMGKGKAVGKEAIATTHHKQEARDAEGNLKERWSHIQARTN